jgi:hypothetical protein
LRHLRAKVEDGITKAIESNGGRPSQIYDFDLVPWFDVATPHLAEQVLLRFRALPFPRLQHEPAPDHAIFVSCRSSFLHSRDQVTHHSRIKELL